MSQEMIDYVYDVVDYKIKNSALDAWDKRIISYMYNLANYKIKDNQIIIDALFKAYN